MPIDHNMPAADYHAVDAISSTQLKDVCKGGVALWRYNQEHPFEETAAMTLGELVHLLCLEPHRIDDFAVMPKFSGKGMKQRKADWLTEHEGKLVYPAKMVKDAQYCLDSVMSVPSAIQLLAGKHEVSAFCKLPEFDVKAKARIDVAGNGWLADVKTCANSSLYKFKNAIRDLHYDVQGAFYLDVWAVVAKLYEHFVFVSVQTSKPFTVGLYELSQYDLDIARDKWHVAIQQIQDYKATGVMPPNCHTDKVEIISVA